MHGGSNLIATNAGQFAVNGPYLPPCGLPSTATLTAVFKVRLVFGRVSIWLV